MSKQFITLDEILSKDGAVLTAIKQGEFNGEKLGLIPFVALNHDEYKTVKNACITYVKASNGAMSPQIDDDKLMLQVIVTAVDKDKRSDFTFANKKLFDKLKTSGLEVNTAESAVKALLSPGEINSFAIAIQEVSGFGPRATKENAEAIKNS